MPSVESIYNSIYRRVKTAYCKKRDFRTDRHIVVFESDDWGSIRMSSRKAWDCLRNMGYHVDERPYERYDILESEEDVTALAEVLLKFKDCKGNHPVITLNYLAANPDFEAIRKNGISEYCYESVENTYLKYPQNHHHVLELVRKGINEGIFKPQCHGREHFNVLAWMRALQACKQEVVDAFNYNMCGIAPMDNPQLGNRYMVAFESRSAEEQEYVCHAVEEGLVGFEQLWGFPSMSFVAPCYTWNESIESVLHNHCVQLIQTSRIQHLSDKKKDVYRYSGETNKWHQYYSIRNCFFEPSTSLSPENEVNSCFNSIKGAFENHKIAVVSSHRINYVGGISEQNRKQTLSMLDNLLLLVIDRFPDVEFLSSDELIQMLKTR